MLLLAYSSLAYRNKNTNKNERMFYIFWGGIGIIVVWSTMAALGKVVMLIFVDFLFHLICYNYRRH